MKQRRPDVLSTIDDAPVRLVRAVDAVMRWRVLLLLVCLVMAVLAVRPSWRLEFDRSLEGLFTKGDPRLVSFVEDKELFGGTESGLVAYTDPQLLTAVGLLRLEQLDTSLRKVPGVEDVISLARARLPGAPL
ncbi:MAG: hypothetical protein ABI614_08335, partial [Planctomycetota bacterium]